MSENVADLAHFSSVHELEMRQWDVEEMGHRRCVVGRAEGSRDKECWEITVVYEGPALGSSHYKGACEMVQLSSVTPLGDDVVKLSFEFLLPSRDGARDQYLLGRLLARRMIKIIDDDVEIWEHKRYLGKPMLMPEERSVLEFRRWIGSM